MNVFRHQNDSTHTDRLSLTTPQISGRLRGRQLRRRYGSEVLGALLFIAAIVAFNSLTHGATSQGAKAQSSTTPSSTISDKPSLPNNQASAPASSEKTTVKVNKEDSSMADSANGDVTARVTVNGVDVPVPFNGTSQQTIVGDGSPTSVTITSGQSTTGRASGTNRTSTHLNVSTTTRSNDSTTESWGETP